jgi:hypothetical protein
MKDRDDHDLAGFFFVQHSIGELPNHCPANILVYGGVWLRVGRDSSERLSHPFQKCRAQSRSLLFVPVYRGVELVFGFGQQADG